MCFTTIIHEHERLIQVNSGNVGPVQRAVAAVQNQTERFSGSSRNLKLVLPSCFPTKPDLHTVTKLGAPCFTYNTNKVQRSVLLAYFITNPKTTCSGQNRKFCKPEAMLPLCKCLGVQTAEESRRSQTAWVEHFDKLPLCHVGHPACPESTVNCGCA